MAQRSFRRLVVVVLLAPAFVLLLRGLPAPLQGEHVFRQAHVAANVEKFVAHGLSLVPDAYNKDIPGALFEFPIYSWIVALLVRLSGLPVVFLARAVNVAMLALVLGLCARLWRQFGASWHQRAFGLAACAYAPLTLFYFQVPLPDPLAVCLSLGSLLAYLRSQADADVRAQRGGWAMVLLCGGLATLIKSPIYLPVAIAIAWDLWRQRGWRGLASHGFVAFALGLVFVVVGFKLYSNQINAASGFLAAGEGEAYFGVLRDRWRPRLWKLIAAIWLDRVTVPVGLALAVAGLSTYVWRGRARRRHLPVGLALGALVTLLVFFNRFREHAYYHLPFVPSVAFFVGYLPGLGATWLRARRAPAALSWIGLGAGVFVLALTGFAQREHMDADWDAGMVERGAFVLAHTRADDFVVYVLGVREDNWEPSHLYFAQRDGYNLARRLVTAEQLAELRFRFPLYRRLLVFVPAAALGEVGGRLDRLGARVLADEPELGRLYLP